MTIQSTIHSTPKRIQGTQSLFLPDMICTTNRDGNTLQRDWLYWTNVIKNTSIVHLRSPFVATLSKKLYYSDYGLVYCKLQQNTFHILSYPANDIKYTVHDAKMYKRKCKYVCVLTNNKVYNINLNTFNEQIFDINSLNVTAFDMFYDEVTKVYRIVTFNLQHEMEMITNSTYERKKMCNNEIMNVHLIGTNYITESLFHIYPFIKSVSYLQHINKWFIQYETYFLILNDTGIKLLFDSNVVNIIDSSDTEYGMVYNISMGTNQIVFSNNESVVIYEYMNRIYIAQTMSPYLITCTDSFLNPLMLNPNERILDIWLNKDVYVKTSQNRIYILSMFPISLTASTRIATTFE